MTTSSFHIRPYKSFIINQLFDTKQQLDLVDLVVKQTANK
jgi:hypothetical protein